MQSYPLQYFQFTKTSSFVYITLMTLYLNTVNIDIIMRIELCYLDDGRVRMCCRSLQLPDYQV